MSWISTTWSAVAGICIALSVLNLLVWMKSRDASAHLFFAIAALTGAVIAVMELEMMKAQSPQEFGDLLRWYHLPAFAMIVALLGFVRTYLQAGRLWLLWLVIGMRLLALVINFSVEPNLNFTEISGLHPIVVLGETVVLPVGERSAWANFTAAGSILFLIFVLDAAISAWRTNHGRRAKVVGISFGSAIFMAIVVSDMLTRGALPAPFTLSIPFLIILAGIGYEMSMELVRVNQLSHELQESQERLSLATSAADIGVWDWDVEHDSLWITDTIRRRLGASENETIRFDRYLKMLHPDDRDRIQQVARDILEKAGEFDVEYRIIDAQGELRWIQARGRVENGAPGKTRRVRGVSLDITRSRMAEVELQERRRELLHFGRVSALGQLSSALAHEISQPLGAILRNAEAGGLFLERTPPDAEELRAILLDIRQDEERAASVIERMRSLLQRRNLAFETLVIEQVMREVLELVHVELQMRQAEVHVDVPHGIPRVLGDRIHLQQVILNLLLNSLDALDESAEAARKIVIHAARTGADMVELAVIDSGAGISAEQLPHMFDPFFTTKKDGTGVGLAISKTIIEAHGGRLTATNNPGGGATIRFTLRTVPEAAGG